MAGSVVRVTTTSSLAALVLLPSLQLFSHANPNISVEVSTGDATSALPALEALGAMLLIVGAELDCRTGTRTALSGWCSSAP